MDRVDFKKSKPILFDPLIIPRVKQYLEENVHQTYVDVGLMAKTLQDRYREYSRRKAVPFRQLVEQAYKTVLHSYGLDSNPSSDENDDGSDLELMEDRPEGNHMNNVLTNMYANNTNNVNNANNAANANKEPQQGNDGMLAIDISSDESGGEEEKIPKNKNQFPSCIQISINKVPQKKVDAKAALKKQAENTVNSLPENVQAIKKRKLDNDVDLSRLDVTIRDKFKNQKLDDNQSARSTPLSISAVPATASLKSSKKFKKEVSVQISSYTFKDVGGMDKILKELCELLLHIKHPEVYKHIGLPPPRGFLLHGPPGSGKTLLAQAIAGQLKVGLIQIVATELVAGVSGESEERIRELFEQATLLAPCVLFIDEIDAISTNRLNAQKDMERRIVAQLLNSLDSLSNYENGDQVLIIGATNRPDSLDPALRRVGRFDQEICLGIPDRNARAEILKVICSKLKLEQPFNYDDVASLTPGYVGADLLALATRAASIAIKRAFTSKRDNINRKILGRKVVQSYPMVNLTDDTLIMEIDSALEMAERNLKEADTKNETLNTNKQTDKLNGIECTIDITDDKQTEQNVVKEDAISAEKTVLVEVNEASASEETNENIDVETVDKEKPNEILQENKIINEEITTDDKEKNQLKQLEPMVTDETAEKSDTIPKEQPIEQPTEKSTEQSTEQSNEQSTELSTEKSTKQSTVQSAEQPALQKDCEHISVDNEDSIEVDGQAVKSTPTEDNNKDPPRSEAKNTEKMEVDNTAEDDCVIDISDETVEDSITQNSTIKNHLGLAEMTKWLNDKQPPISESELKMLNIRMRDFKDAVKVVQPSAKREGFITVPDVTWDDIGSLREIRDELQLAVLAPVKYPERLKILGLQARSGVLLCGPPGCGKTLLAKAVANEAGINFISVKGPELLNMYVGESERAVRQCFQRARNSAPCVIFFDEFDALCPKRSESSEGNAASRVVNQLLTEMDGIEDRKGVFLMAATNRPDIVDPAVLRPGRLDKILYVGLPELSDRIEILNALTKKKTQPVLADDVNLESLAELTVNYTGADLAGLVRQASLNALKESIKLDSTAQNTNADSNYNSIKVNKYNFLEALKHIRPSVSEKDKCHYEKIRQQYATSEQMDGY